MCCFDVFPEQRERPCSQGWNARSDALWWFKEGNEEAHCDPLKLPRKPGKEIWNYPKRDLMRTGGLTPHPVGSLMVTNSQALSFMCLPVALHPAAQGTWIIRLTLWAASWYIQVCLKRSSVPMFSSLTVPTCSDPTATQTSRKSTFLWDCFSGTLAEN